MIIYRWTTHSHSRTSPHGATTPLPRLLHRVSRLDLAHITDARNSGTKLEPVRCKIASANGIAHGLQIGWLFRSCQWLIRGSLGKSASRKCEQGCHQRHRAWNEQQPISIANHTTPPRHRATKLMTNSMRWVPLGRISVETAAPFEPQR